MLHNRVGVIGTDKYSVPGQETVGIQDPMGAQSKVLSNDMQYAFATALLDQLEDYGADVKEHCRRLRTGQYPAKPQLEAKPSLEIRVCNFGIFSALQKFNLTTQITNYVKCY